MRWTKSLELSMWWTKSLEFAEVVGVAEVVEVGEVMGVVG